MWILGYHISYIILYISLIFAYYMSFKYYCWKFVILYLSVTTADTWLEYFFKVLLLINFLCIFELLGTIVGNLMFIGPCVLVIVEEWKTSFMSLAILFHFLCAQHVSDINISIIRSLRLFYEIPHRSSCSQFVLCWRFGAAGFRWCSFCRLKHNLCFSLQHGHYSNPTAPNLQHTTNWEQNDRCGNSTTQLQAPDDGYINVRNMLNMLST